MKSLRQTSYRLCTLMLLLALAMFPLPTQAEEVVYAYQYGQFQNDTTVYLFGDRVNVREKPSTSAKAAGMLPIGTRLTIVSGPDGSFTSNGLTSGWYKVRSADAQKPLEGYVWGGLLALAAVTFTDEGNDCLMMAGITAYAENQFKGEMRLLVGGTLKAKSSFDWTHTSMGDSSAYTYSARMQELPWPGPALKRLFQLNCEYGACGYTQGNLLFFWDGENVINGPTAESVSEAGVFSVSSEFIFPEAGSVPAEKLVVRTTTIEETDEQGRTPARARKVETTHIWNNKSWNAEAPVETELPPVPRIPDGDETSPATPDN